MANRHTETKGPQKVGNFLGLLFYTNHLLNMIVIEIMYLSSDVLMQQVEEPATSTTQVLNPVQNICELFSAGTQLQ